MNTLFKKIHTEGFRWYDEAIYVLLLATVSSVIVGTVSFGMTINNDFSIANKIWDRKWNSK